MHKKWVKIGLFGGLFILTDAFSSTFASGCAIVWIETDVWHELISFAARQDVYNASGSH